MRALQVQVGNLVVCGDEDLAHLGDPVVAHLDPISRPAEVTMQDELSLGGFSACTGTDAPGMWGRLMCFGSMHAWRVLVLWS